MADSEWRSHPNSALRLVRSVAILALPAEAQVEWLRSLGLGEPGIVDELALEFDEGWSAIQSFRAENWIPDRAMESLRKIDTLLDSISGASGPWLVEDLSTAPEWQQMRCLAAECLYQLH